MGKYTQANRKIAISTPLGKDVLLLVGFTGREGVSHPFSFQLDLLADNDDDVPFDKVLGQKVTVEVLLPSGKKRHWHGIVSRFGQGSRDTWYTRYWAEIVPQFWFLTKKVQSRIFQHVAVPDILKKILEGIDTDFQLQGAFKPRDYCVQYRESDFDFASRLMEEEGIYYFFKHTADGHKMVVANAPSSHPDMPDVAKLTFDVVKATHKPDDRVYEWDKTQEIRSGKYTLWDHCFELPHKHLEADKAIQDSAAAGKVTHKLKVGGNDKLEVYDFPGAYAQRFDGIDKGGGEQPANLENIFTDNKRTVGIRMEQEALASVVVQARATVRNLVTGHKFTLEKHFNADGPYLVTSAEHAVHIEGDFHSGTEGKFLSQVNFTAIPIAVPFRPPQKTPKPFVRGTQTAIVVGPAGQEIFTDKYGRVKVQFFWDRQGKTDADSSCWVRVTQPWAGKRWGASFWPRIGQEVIVDFLEGDPDQPIIVGTVYNADQMPPYLGQGLDSKHPNDTKVCGVKSNSTPGGEGFNEWRFDDSKGGEQIFIHAQKDMDARILNDSRELVLNNRHLIVGEEEDGEKVGNQHEMVMQDKHLHIHRNHLEHIGGNMELLVGEEDGGGNQDIIIKKHQKELIEGTQHLHVKEEQFELVDKDRHKTIKGNSAEQIDGTSDFHVKKERTEKIGGTLSLGVGGDRKTAIGANDHLEVKGDRKEKLGGNQHLTVGGNQQEKVGMNHAVDAGMEIHLKAGMKVIIEAGVQLSLKGPGGFIDIGPAGVAIQGIMVLINSGGSAGSGSGASPEAPEAPAAPQEPNPPTDAKQAAPVDPAVADDSKSGQKSVPDSFKALGL